MRIFFLFLTLILAAALIAGGYYWWQKGKRTENKTLVAAPGTAVVDILFLTNPVTEFAGKIDKIADDSIVVSGKYTIAVPATAINAPTPLPGQVITVPPLPPSKTLTYTVKVQSYTLINRPDSPVPYMIKKITPTPTPKLTIKDLKAGTFVTVSAVNDLRTLKTAQFDAASIKLPPILNTITGKITTLNVSDGIIVIKAIQPVRTGTNEPTPETPKEVEYAISVTGDTEISRLGATPTPAKASQTPKPAEPLVYKLSDLKTDIQITVYTDLDVIENQKLKALRIEPPIDLFPAPVSSPSATPTTPAKT